MLCLFILLGWFALHEEQSPLDQQPAKVELAKPQVRQVAPAFEPDNDVPNETPTNHPEDLVPTNAAVIYRQAFALFDELSKEHKTIVSDWQTNVAASVEAELCEKIRPICELMHQASAATNCDWGIEPITLETPLPHLAASRNIARAAVWNAAHCRANNVVGGMNDVLSVLKLGHSVSRTANIGCQVDMALQNMTTSFVAQNLRLFGHADVQRLVTAFDDPSYKEAPSRALEEEADIVDRVAAKFALLPEAEMNKALADLEYMNAPELDRTAVFAAFKQVADSDRKLAKALLSSSEDECKAWLDELVELKASNPLASAFLGAHDLFVDKVRRAAVNRALVMAGLAVAQEGMDALQSHIDPTSGKPFVYTETPNGFELESSYEINGKPMKMQFK